MKVQRCLLRHLICFCTEFVFNRNFEDIDDFLRCTIIKTFLMMLVKCLKIEFRWYLWWKLWCFPQCVWCYWWWFVNSGKDKRWLPAIQKALPLAEGILNFIQQQIRRCGDTTWTMSMIYLFIFLHNISSYLWMHPKLYLWYSLLSLRAS